MIRNNMSNSLWTEKYRPHTMDGYIGNDLIKDTMNGYILNGDIPHILLHARAGTGKTTLGKVLVNNIDCDVLFLNASDDNNVDTIRTKIKGFVSSASFRKWKVVFLDEADYLTPQAQAVLRNLMETFSKNSRFILTCNYSEKIIDPVKSRCTVFQILPPSKTEVAKRMVHILDMENISYNIKDVATIVSNNYPDIRRAINALQMQVNKQTSKLILSQKQATAMQYVDKIITALKGPGTKNQIYRTIRQIIADSGVKSFEELYTALYENLDSYAGEGQQAGVILKIAEGQRDDAMVVDHEINVMAMLINIIEILNN